MAAAAERAAWRPLLKVKLGGGDDDASASPRCAARRRAPSSSSTPTRAGAPTISPQNLAACADAGVTLVEQPLPEGARRGARAHPAADPGLRRRERARPRFARRACRQVRRRQHQARQGRRPDRGIGACRAPPNSAAWPSWSAAWWRPRWRWRRRCWWRSVRAWSISTGRSCLAKDRAGGPALRRQPRLSARTGAVGLTQVG